MESLAIILLLAISVKAVVFGSQFNFIKWIKYRGEYMRKYNKWQDSKP